jgi:HSP20 family protein
MTLVRKNQNWLPSVFNDLFVGDWDTVSSSRNTPSVNILEHKNNFEVQVAAPGAQKADFNLHIDTDNDLVVTMEKKTENTVDASESRYLRREFNYSKFEQSIILPENADKENISAKMENGILHIEIPKIKIEDRKAKQRTIEIQ